jgi:HlyD family secretion protein
MIKAISILKSLVVVAGFLVCAGCDAGSSSSGPANVMKEKNAVTALGRVVTGRSIVSIAAPPGDRLLRLEVQEGRKVAASEVLAYLESYNLRVAETNNAQAVVVQAREAISLLEAELDHERANLKRTESLHKDKVIAEQNYDDQKFLVKSRTLALSKAMAELRVAETQLAAAVARLELSVIRAPSAGQVLRIFTYPGEKIGASPILQMGDTDRMYVIAEVHETDIGAVRVGQSAVVTSPALQKALAGTVEEIGWLVSRNNVLDVDPRADIDTRVVEVRVRLEDSAAVANLSNLKVHVKIDLKARPGGAAGPETPAK